MNPLSEKFEHIKHCCDVIEDAGVNCYKLFDPLSSETIAKWETDNGAALPEGLKNWLLLSNGFEMGSSADILPLEHIRPFPPEINGGEYAGYFIAGHYIGDGSALVCSKDGRFFELDHAYDILEEMTFEEFLDSWVLDVLEDDMAEAREILNQNK